MLDFVDQLDSIVSAAKEAGMDLEEIIADLEGMIAGLEAEMLG